MHAMIASSYYVNVFDIIIHHNTSRDTSNQYNHDQITN